MISPEIEFSACDQQLNWHSRLCDPTVARQISLIRLFTCLINLRKLTGIHVAK